MDDHVSAIVRAFQQATPRCGSTRVLAVDGRSGSGKSALAGELVLALDLAETQVIPLDRIYPGWDGLAAGVEWLVEGVLAPLAEGRPAGYPVWDWATARWSGRVEVPPTDVLLLEGCGSSVGRAGAYAALRVWVEAPQPVRYARAMARDGELFRPYWDRWARQEKRMYADSDPRRDADVVVWTG